jgi:3-oxoadipate CoA-transferase, beta subunit
MTAEPERLEPALMAIRVAQEFRDGDVVNLGMGLPLLCSDYIPDGREVLFHSEQGIVGFGPIASSPEEVDLNLMNAGGLPVTSRPGMALMSHDESFAMIRGGHIGITVLGALQIGANRDLANMRRPGRVIGNIGGAQDLATCCPRVIVMMHHTTPLGAPKILPACNLDVTVPACVDLAVTDVGVFEFKNGRVTLLECAPGWSAGQIQEITGTPLTISPDLRDVEIRG